jgi:3alpha(or 20beta)-hydroxysteroid dehydrogenase
MASPSVKYYFRRPRQGSSFPETDRGETMGTLDGKVAIVTGAARGTGEATARLMVAEGASVLMGDILDDRGESAAKALGERARYAHLDVTSEADWQRAVELAVASYGRLDVLVNNAGILHMSAIADTELADFERVVRINQVGTFLGIKSVIEPMKELGAGSIVNISSIDGRTAKNGLVAYASSKWAVRGITRVAALELGKFGIRVNCVCPEAGNTEMIAKYVPEGVDIEKLVAHTQPILSTQRNRPSQARMEDIAKLVVFLASDASASCTGGDFPIDGGNTAGSIVRGAPGA